MASIKFDKLLAEAHEDDEYWVEAAKVDFAVELNTAREAAGISKSELARRIGTSAAYITKVLRGDTNFTIGTMVRLARSLGCFLQLGVTFKAEHQVAETGSPIAIRIGRPAFLDLDEDWRVAYTEGSGMTGEINLQIGESAEQRSTSSFAPNTH